MVSVSEQYEAYPYPERKPEDERRRLITGSPSHPLEMDHFLWAGKRDWSKPLRALFAGGGSGDGLIQLATVLQEAGRPYEITYVDLSRASRRIAEERAKIRGLSNINFTTGSLLDAPDLGRFDYIDCCGVLHHLPDPAAGFQALRGALALDGGMGVMVYAPYGRSGVYPLQEAFCALFQGMKPDQRLKHAREILERVPEGHPFRTNPNLVDHQEGDAGFYDLLLHSQDRPYSAAELLAVLDETDWQLASFTTPALYDLARYAPVPNGLSEQAGWGIAEKLNGSLKTHVAYVVAKGETRHSATFKDRSLVPHFKGIKPAALAQAVAKGRKLPISQGALRAEIVIPQDAARLIAAVNGRRTLGEIAGHANMDPIAFGGVWGKVEAALEPWGLLMYSGLLK